MSRLYSDYQPPKACFIGAYAVTVGIADRAYGGPEEGGWWFDTFEPLRSFIVPYAAKERLERRLRAYCTRHNEGRADLNSVTCEGVYVLDGGITTRPQPEVIPHYE